MTDAWQIRHAVIPQIENRTVQFRNLKLCLIDAMVQNVEHVAWSAVVWSVN